MDMENYEKKHKEEVIRATQLWECGDITREQLEYIFPELKESEDERIRKSLMDFFDSANKIGENPMYEYGIHTDKILAWLEKQGEQKPTWSKEDEIFQQEQDVDLLKSLKPKTDIEQNKKLYFLV